ncbi:homoserine O-acetyltransferase [Bacillus spongiae]|uniref:Homoserine O-acetyltransferase n=1 Tax=Bacillus spongiae TaxID=2683610 RepID=A0ABU8HEM8_9BACI
MRREGKVILNNFCFQDGTELSKVEIAYEWVGEEHNPFILICHALTGDHRAAGTEKNPGWWHEVIGPKKTIDTDRFQVITLNVLGGCHGSSGPMSINTLTNEPYRLTFPPVTIRDIVHSHRAALDVLGINEVEAVIGGSLGGMQALEWGLLYPTFMNRLVVLAATPFLSDYAIAFNTIGTLAIQNDPKWDNGNYDQSSDLRGLEIARMAGMVTYRSREVWNETFNRKKADNDVFEVESYLAYHGKNLAHRFDANSYLLLMKAMNSHDIGSGRGGWKRAAKQYKSKVKIIAFQGDLLYPSDALSELSELVPKGEFHEVKLKVGHDGFLVQFEKWEYLISTYLPKLMKDDQKGNNVISG